MRDRYSANSRKKIAIHLTVQLVVCIRLLIVRALGIGAELPPPFDDESESSTWEW
jgi:hypothetical protein